jgi:uncharacterized protein YbjT (DUF2867 family)
MAVCGVAACGVELGALWCMRVVVVGASGFVGRALSLALVDAGHQVAALSRHAPEIPGAEGRAVDVADVVALRESLAGCEIAYYLVHSLAAGDFRARDRQLAEGFGRSAAAAGVGRIVYLGGLGRDPESEHLLSRQEVGTALACGDVPVVELRAAVVLGAGSISFEMLRYLTERLPFMVCPRWVRTAIQPIALSDVIRYLIGAIAVEPGIYEIGGADVTSYRKMIAAYAEVRGLRVRPIFDVPYLTPRLSSYWLDLVTPVDRHVSHALIESLATEVVVHDRARTDAAFGIGPIGLTDALSAALDDQARALDRDLFNCESGLRDGVYTVRVSLSLPDDVAVRLDADLERIGGTYSWYGLALGWRLRAALGRLAGEHWELRAPPAIVEGERVDWWLVVRREPGVLVLRSVHWVPGEAWLGYRCDRDELVQVGSLRPKGVPGFLYWKILRPMHPSVFNALARYRLKEATRT